MKNSWFCFSTGAVSKIFCNELMLWMQLWEDKDAKKAMSKNNAKGLTTLRQRLKKYNKDFENELKVYFLYILP